MKVSLADITKEKGTACQPVLLTSTKGQIDINCLAVDKVTKMEYKPEIVLDKAVAPLSSSWRPKMRSTASVNTSRTFTTLGAEALTTVKTLKSNSDVDDNNSSSINISPFSPLSISGSIPIIAPDNQELSNEATMELIYLHLTNSGQIAAPNSSTISVPRVNADLLHEIDRTTQNITQRITSHQTDNVEGELNHIQLNFINFCLDDDLNFLIPFFLNLISSYIGTCPVTFHTTYCLFI